MGDMCSKPAAAGQFNDVTESKLKSEKAMGAKFEYSPRTSEEDQMTFKNDAGKQNSQKDAGSAQKMQKNGTAMATTLKGENSHDEDLHH
mmetsp:Transcript_18074/g.13117  ORF Transcript_18074/g.13117 Transcript_18074/m.13117 type:complete len:89 (+) Transcript_18074:55-321(+)